MAKRESQGLQIALILLVMLTVILCIATYFFWSQSRKLDREVASARETASTAENNVRLKIEENQKFKQFLGHDPNADIAEIEKTYAEDMLLYGQSVPEGERNYRDLPAHLVKVIQERNQRINELTELESKLKQTMEQIRTEEQQRVAVAEEGLQKAGQDLEAERQAFQKSINDMTAQVQQIERRHAESRNRLSAEKNKLAGQLATATEDLATLRRQHDDLKETLRRLQLKTFEHPDGIITYVNSRSETVYINLGRVDSLQRQATFSVYDVDENNLARAEPKGSIEVTRILGDHLSEARILEDSVTDPMISGDAIYSPVWQAGRPVRFALAGLLDVNQDGASDLELVKNLISLNGGIVDAVVDENGRRTGDISIETRYLVIGKRPSDKSAADTVREFSRIREEAETYGVTEISIDRFLADMGYQSVGRSVPLGTSARATDFRPPAPPAASARFRPRYPTRRSTAPASPVGPASGSSR